MKCLGISLFLGGYFIFCPAHFSFPWGGISFLALRIFHSLKHLPGHFISYLISVG